MRQSESSNNQANTPLGEKEDLTMTTNEMT